MSGGSVAPGAAPARSQDLVVDRLRWWDLDEVLALEADLFPESPWTPGQFWSELARVPESRWYVAARRGGRIVGYAGVFLVVPEADVQTIAVAAPEQGRGTGRALLAALVEHAGAHGARTLHLEVRADRPAALGLYESMGFAVDGRRRDYYGRGHDALLMSRRLPSGGGGASGPALERSEA
jgi:ribosomal-protein-alanine N-acetyltransferase